MAKATRRKIEPAPVVQDQPVVDQTPVTTEGQNETNVPGQPAATEPEPPKTEPAPATNNGQQPVVTQELITAQFKVGLTRLRYEEALQGFASLKVTEDTIGDVQEKLKKGRGLIRKMDEMKSDLKEKALIECRMWDAAFKSLAAPLEEHLMKIQTNLNRIAQEQARKAEEARKEEQRKADIRTAIDNFILEQSQAIATAKGDTELVRIQKFIGSAKANTTRYQEFLPDLIARCAELNPLINTQKEAIRELRELEEKKKAAEKAGDDATLIAIEEKKEQLNATIDEQKVLVQETAINQATKTSDVVIARPVYNTVKARRSKWKAELKTDDKSMKTAFNAGLLTCDLDKEKVELLIDTLQQTKQLEGKEEFEINGIRLYLEKLY
jgi:hypothetical protein